MNCKKESNNNSVFVNSIVFKKFGKDNKFKIAETFNQDFVKNFMQEKEDCINMELDFDDSNEQMKKNLFLQSTIPAQNLDSNYLFTEVSKKDISNLINAISN